MNEGPINVKNGRHKFLQYLQTSLSITAFEEVLVDIVNKVGVDINHAVADPYYHCHYIYCSILFNLAVPCPQLCGNG